MVTTTEEVDKDTKILDNKKDAGVTTPLLKKKLRTTEKVTTSEVVHKGTKKWIIRKGQWSRHHCLRKMIYNQDGNNK